MTRKTQTCLACNKPITRGRVDKRFCNDECRDEYHNARKLEDGLETRQIMLTLKHNRRVLRTLLGRQPEIIVDREMLLKKGFDFDYHTHHILSHHKSHEYVFCFNYGYWAMGNDRFKIVKRFENKTRVQ